jgi:hypothetical protein
MARIVRGFLALFVGLVAGMAIVSLIEIDSVLAR